MALTKTFLLSLLLTIFTVSALPLQRRQSSPASVQANFPDPTYIHINDTYYAFATSGNGHNIQIATSNNPFTSSQQWSLLSADALPNLPGWSYAATTNAGTAHVWAPYIHQLPDSTFILYFSTPSSSDPTRHCIGTATSATITGPFSPSSNPWTCPLAQGGAIDPALFTDPASGNLYVLYKIDGNSLNAPGSNTYAPTPIMLQQIQPSDGATPIGDPVQVLDHDSTQPLVEAPAMFFDAESETYFLLYSANMFSTSNYNLLYATASSITGPYTPAQSPLLATGDFSLNGPGSADVDAAGGQIVFHSTVSSGGGSQAADNGPLNRWMYSGGLHVENGGLSVPQLY